MAESLFLNPERALRAAGVYEGMRAADFGSGSGFFTLAAARSVGRQGLVFALDADRALLARTKTLAHSEGLRNVEVVACDLEGPRGSHLPDESMDAVIASNIFFSAQNRAALLGEILRVLKKNGMALVIDWKDSFGGIGPSPLHVCTEADARALFQQSGLPPVHSVPAGSHHWGFKATRRV